MSNSKSSSGVAFHVGQQLRQLSLIHESGYNKTGVVENTLNGDVLCGIVDLFEVVNAWRECYCDGSEFELWELILKLLRCVF